MNSRNLQGFDRISCNLDVLEYIFQFLDIGNQLKLANVSEHLQYVFKTFIWKENYKKITIRKYGEAVSLTNNLEKSNIDLNLNEFEYFLNIYGHDILELNENHGCAFITHKLENLTAINYNHLMITTEHLELLAKNCLKLEKLSIYGCCNKNRDILQIGKDVKVETLLKMKMLKQFTLVCRYEFEQGIFQDLLTKLKHFNLKDVIVTEQEKEDVFEISDYSMEDKSSIEDLDIFASFNSSISPRYFYSFIKSFENLINLKLSIIDVVTSDMILAISKVCTKLKYLLFKNTAFKNISQFSILSSLEDLLFFSCDGLTYDNLRDILSEMKLTRFTSINTKYVGIFHYYFISPTIKSLHIDAFKSFKIISDSEINNNSS